MERYTTCQVTPYFAEGERYPGLIGVKAEGDEYETAYVCKTELIAAIEERDALKAYIDRKEHIHNVFEKDRRIAELESLVRDMGAALIHNNCYRWCEAQEPCNMIDDGKCQYRERMRSLGIEVG